MDCRVVEIGDDDDIMYFDFRLLYAFVSQAKLNGIYKFIEEIALKLNDKFKKHS